MFLKKNLLMLLVALLSLMQVKANTANDSVTTILIKAIGGLQYDVVQFNVKPGAKMRIILNNTDDMNHNLVFTQPGSRLKVVNAALALGGAGLKMNYVPKSKDVLWYIPILSPGETKSITFTAPAKEGVYPYVCTYPGHGMIMFGQMNVSRKNVSSANEVLQFSPGKNKNGTAINNTLQHHEVKKQAHPYKEIPPYLYRIFLPGASPAAIAVNLPNNISYCWDAGTCHLRFAWQGGFLDNTDIWKGHYDAYGTILGTIFFTDKTDFPLRIDEPGNIPSVQFKGYRLIDRYPEFHYTINGIDVYELIKPTTDGTGLIRTFKIPNLTRTIWFVTDAGDGVNYISSQGFWENNQLILLPDEASLFTLTMTKR